MIRDTDPTRFVNRMQIAINAGASIVRTYSILEWRYWRLVRVYIAETDFVLPKQKLLLTFGPVRERPIPPGPEE